MASLNKLEDYRTRNKYSFKKLAGMLEIHERTARRHCRPLGDLDFHLPIQKTMEKIIIITEGYVQPNDFYHISLKQEV
jgi:hypothetical protein